MVIVPVRAFSVFCPLLGLTLSHDIRLRCVDNTVADHACETVEETKAARQKSAAGLSGLCIIKIICFLLIKLFFYPVVPFLAYWFLLRRAAHVGCVELVVGDLELRHDVGQSTMSMLSVIIVMGRQC